MRTSRATTPTMMRAVVTTAAAAEATFDDYDDVEYVEHEIK